MAKLTTEERLEQFAGLTLVELNDFVKAYNTLNSTMSGLTKYNAETKKGARLLNLAPFEYGVDEGDRTLDNGSHNPVLYQLSYAHHIA